MLAPKPQLSKPNTESPIGKANRPSQTEAGPASNPVWAWLAFRLQPKLTVSAPDDPYEREADRVADQVMRMPEPRIQRQCADTCTDRGAPMADHQRNIAAEKPSSRRAEEVPPSRVLGLGSPLPHRSSFEWALGADFSSVRVHASGSASEHADNLGARAFALGNHIAFGKGQFDASSQKGRTLIEHELLHTLESPSATPRLDQKNKKKKTFYDVVQELVDSEAGVFLGHSAALEALLDLCVTVDAGDASASKKKTVIFLKEIAQRSLDPAKKIRLDDVGLELISRTFLLGLESESADLRREFLQKGASSYLSPFITERFAPEITAFDKIVDDVIASVKVTDADQAEASIDLLTRTYTFLARQAMNLNPTEIAADEERNRRSYAQSISEPFDIPRPTYSKAEFFAKLIGRSVDLVTPMNIAFQVLMDEALASTKSAGDTAALVRAKTNLEGKILPTLDLSDEKLDPNHIVRGRRLKADVDVTKSTFRAGKGGTYHDVFAKGRAGAKRDVGFGYFDTTQSSGDEKSLRILWIFEARKRQIAFLESLHAAPAQSTVSGGAVPGKSNSELLKELGGLDLESNEGWRNFLLRHFEEGQKNLGKDEALIATVDFLQGYLAAFTISTPYDIDDFGDNYLSRTFPRALTGQLVHDCGVYALRVAYALSKVRDQLGLSFKAILLPHHIGLIISSTAGPVFIVHNSQITKLTANEVAATVKQWSEHDAQGNKLAQPVAPDQDQALAEAAASLFSYRTDLPYRTKDVPTNTSGAGLKKDLWKMFQTEAKKDLFKPSKDVAQPGLPYLAALHAAKDAHNDFLVPFWNVIGPVIFKKHQKAITEAAALIPKINAGGATQAELLAEYKKLIEPYRTDLVAAFGQVTNAYDPTSNVKGPSASSQVMAGYEATQARRDEASAMIAKDPKLVAPGGTIAYWRRLGLESEALTSMSSYLDDRLPKAVDVQPPFLARKNLPYAY
ncbi:MAG: eCIS core domain-containing protein [Candidatus Binatia bacterium]